MQRTYMLVSQWVGAVSELLGSASSLAQPSYLIMYTSISGAQVSTHIQGFKKSAF
jgi:hypothetical protein